MSDLNACFRAIPSTDKCLEVLASPGETLSSLVSPDVLKAVRNAPRSLVREAVQAFWDARREAVRQGGQFLAIILPPSREKKPVRVVVALAVALSLCFRYVPGLNSVSSGFAIIICAVAAAAVGAIIYPAEEESA